jgi:hypothetical protein
MVSSRLCRAYALRDVRPSEVLTMPDDIESLVVDLVEWAALLCGRIRHLAHLMPAPSGVGGGLRPRLGSAAEQHEWHRDRRGHGRRAAFFADAPPAPPGGQRADARC